MGHIWKGFSTTVFAVLTAICLVLFSYDNSVGSTATSTVWAWGYNDYGELGNGSTTSSATPVQVSGISGVVAVAAGWGQSFTLKSDGTVWAWGDNGSGELGNGSTNNSDVPVQVSGLSGVIAIAAGEYHSLALKSDGTIWAWGYNADGELGNGSTNNSDVPVQVSGLSGLIAVAGGAGHSLVVQAANVFGDIPDGYWAEQYIDAIYNDGITTGCQNGSIYLNCAPDGSDDVWRDQMAAFIIRALYGGAYTPMCNGGTVACSTTSPVFSDVTLVTEPIFFPYIQKLYELGITNSPGGVYNPSQTVTRGEMAAFLVRALQVQAGQPALSAPYYTQTPYFTDVPTDSTFFLDVQRLKDLGITTVTGTYGVDETVTRDQMAAFIARAFLGMH